MTLNVILQSHLKTSILLSVVVFLQGKVTNSSAFSGTGNIEPDNTISYDTQNDPY